MTYFYIYAAWSLTVGIIYYWYYRNANKETFEVIKKATLSQRIVLTLGILILASVIAPLSAYEMVFKNKLGGNKQ
jgi:dipeptide/tripeptide permease